MFRPAQRTLNLIGQTSLPFMPDMTASAFSSA
jgi:hypothetical protein